MKQIVCFIRPARLDAVLTELAGGRTVDITYSEVRGYGRQKGHLDAYRADDFTFTFLPKTRLAVTVEDGDVEHTLDAIMRGARTGRIGDGKILVLDAAAAR